MSQGCPRDSNHVTQLRWTSAPCLLVDMDGTLVDSEPRHIEAHRRNLAAHGIVSSDEALRANIGLSDRVFYATLSARAGAGGFVAVAPDIDRWLAEKTDLLIAMHESEGLSLRPGVEAFLAHVESLALPMYVRAPCSACVRLLLSSTCPHARTRFLFVVCARTVHASVAHRVSRCQMRRHELRAASGMPRAVECVLARVRASWFGGVAGSRFPDRVWLVRPAAPARVSRGL
jgi:hypothetical protein